MKRTLKWTTADLMRAGNFHRLAFRAEAAVAAYEAINYGNHYKYYDTNILESDEFHRARLAERPLYEARDKAVLDLIRTPASGPNYIAWKRRIARRGLGHLCKEHPVYAECAAKDAAWQKERIKRRAEVKEQRQRAELLRHLVAEGIAPAEALREVQ